MKGIFSYTTFGAILLLAFLAQDLFDLRWEYLQTLQADEDYKRWSGLALALIIAFQWSLTIVRVVRRWIEASDIMNAIHKWIGALSPLFFYSHAMELGFAYLFLLSVTFFSNFALGLLNLDTIKSKAQWFYQGWMISHVGLSLFISGVMLYHAWIVFYYE